MLFAVLGTVLLLASEVPIKARAAKCTGNYVPLSGRSGSFQTTNYPSKTEPDETCRWNITVAGGYIVKLSFADFDLGVRDPNSCTSVNVLKVSNTPNARAGLAELCGNKIPDPLFSFGNEMTMEFVSTAQAAYVPKGFNVTYEAIPKDSVCPLAASLSSPSGHILSPYYPRVFPGDDTCTWTITAPSKPYLELNFTAFNVESGCGPDDCGCDYVELYDGNSTNAPRLGKYCGENLAHKKAPSVPLYSSQKNLTVVFHAVPRQIFGNYKGFEAIWEESDFTPQVCTPGTVVQLGGSSGTFNSPRYQDGTYVHSQTCLWLITVPSGSRIKLAFPVFELQETELCLKDAVLVYEGNTEKKKPDWRLCNRFQEGPIVSTGQFLLVKFMSDNTVSYRGFTAKYEVTTDPPSPTTPNVCTPGTVVQLGGSSGTFNSPRYQDGTYVHSQTCLWLITAPSGSRIKLTFPVFELQQTELCLKDAVLVYNGDTVKEKPDWRLCNRLQEGPIVSTGRFLLVKFVSDNTVSYRGFTANYEVTTDPPSPTTTAAPTTPNDAAGYTSSTSALFLSLLVLFVGFLA